MTEQPRTRQELYDRIRQIGKSEFVLEEMIRLGFWPPAGEIPEDPADEIRHRHQLQKQLQELYQHRSLIKDQETFRKQRLKERLAESRRKQQETKERRERERQERAAAWQERKQQEILYLGEGVSGGLNYTQGNLERLQEYDIPAYNTPPEIANAMGISLGELKFLAFHRPTGTLSHYIRFKIPKKTGGERLISAPMPRLKQAQRWILTEILTPLTIHEAAHGFCRDHSIVTNAQLHVGAAVIINFDLKNFFPTISYQRVKGLFRSFGYSESAATIFSLICTELETETVELHGQTYFVATRDRQLPQGSPASPMISNLICRRLDRRLTQIATHLEFTYTRYADDLTFSTQLDNPRIAKLLSTVRSIVNHEGFVINEEKTRVLRRKSSQLDVTGIVVNEKPTIAKQELKRFRATLYQIEKDGPEGKHWGNSTNVMTAIEGFANFVAMVNPEKGEELIAQVKRIKQKWKRK